MDALRIPPRLRPSRKEALQGITIDLRATWVRLHSQLSPTKVWAYNGHFPGPTIEVRYKQRLRVAWTNQLTGRYPVTAYEVPLSTPPASNNPGHREAGATAVEGVADLPPWAVTHLHGSPTDGGNDGWPQNGVLPNDAQLAEYPNDHRATALWYHDHAMNITRWNIFTGLIGMYLVRDEEEDALRLPRGEYEIPLVITDRNLDTNKDGQLTGRLLHKTEIVAVDESGRNVTLPFVGPYTLVNGVIWPYLDVEARWYRFRLLNASNARVFQLMLIDEETGEPVTGVLKQIGTDGGLLARPVPIDGPLEIASAERMDLLIDFSELRGRAVRLVNAAPGVAPGEPNPAAGVPYPQVMQFRVEDRPVRDPFVLPDTLSSFRRITHDNAPQHGHRLVVLTPPGVAGSSGHPEIWEMREVDPAQVQVPSDGVIEIQDEHGERKTYQRIARFFDDTLGFSVELSAWEQWSFLNLAPSFVMHPMHIHMIVFQALSRETYDVSGFDPQLGGTRSPVKFTEPVPIAANEEGWKDTIRVPPTQKVNVIGQFTRATGRFVYHCHILEHEDMAMMRPFVVMPREVMKFGHTGSGGHHG